MPKTHKDYRGLYKRRTGDITCPPHYFCIQCAVNYRLVMVGAAVGTAGGGCVVGSGRGGLLVAMATGGWLDGLGVVPPPPGWAVFCL